MAVKVGERRLANRTYVIAPDGAIAARYDKIHMFDVDLGGGEFYSESVNYQAGPSAILAELPWGRLGLTICYDLRFPGAASGAGKAGAKFIAAPAAFTRTTGEAHWHTLLKARAIETGAYILAAGQGGRHENGRETFGHSLIISPWGEVLAEAGVDPAGRARRYRCGLRRSGAAEDAVADARPRFRCRGRQLEGAVTGARIVIKYRLGCSSGT